MFINVNVCFLVTRVARGMDGGKLSEINARTESRSIEEDGRASRNISIQFPCVPVPFVISSIPGKSYHFPFP